MKKDSFPFNLKWCNALLSQPNDLRLEIYDAIMTYALSGSIVEMSPLAKMAFSFIKEEMDSNIEARNRAIEQRRSAVNSRWAKHKAEQTQQDNCEPYDRIRNDTKNTDVYEKYDRIQGIRSYNSYDLEKERTKEKEDIYNNINNNISLQINSNNKEKKANKKKKVFTESEQQFEDFRQHYPGIKRGFQIEFDNFKKKHPNWQDILPLLIPAVDRLIAYSERCRARGQFVAEYPHLQTWLNQSRWEIEYPEVTDQQNPTNYGTSTLSDYDRRQEEFRQHIIDKLSSPDYDEPDLSDIL